MRRFRMAFLLPLGAIALAATLGGPAMAATTVNVTLWDKGADANMATDLGMNMSGHDMSKATMGVRAIPAAVKAGEVTFEVTNNSSETIHEMIVVPVHDTKSPLPYNDAESRVNEDAAGHLGEVSELDPGKAGALRLHLKPGKYVLFCNIPGHFANGMWAELTVQ
jgi:uncharacterized cupredoxin-like copper-binding protein